MNDEEQTAEEMKRIVINIKNKMIEMKKTRKAIIILGNIIMIYLLIIKSWFYAFITFVMFFPDSEEIIRFVKRKLSKSLNPPENKEAHYKQ